MGEIVGEISSLGETCGEISLVENFLKCRLFFGPLFWKRPHHGALLDTQNIAHHETTLKTLPYYARSFLQRLWPTYMGSSNKIMTNEFFLLG
jgi:hypothetical protein